MGSSNWMNTFTKVQPSVIKHGSEYFWLTITQYNSLCASGVHTAHVVEEPLAESSALSEVYDIWQNAKVLGRLIKASYSLSDVSLDDSFGTLPARDIANTFVHNYVTTMEMSFRILHIPSFIKVYEKYWERPRSVRPVYIAQILLVLSIGARLSCPDEGGPTWNAHQWLHSARCWTLSSSHRECFTMQGLQNKCLVLVSEQVNATGGSPLHFVASALLQSAMYMGLHRDPSHFSSSISTFEGEMRRRLWLTIVEIHIQAALDEGMMSIISGDMYDTKPPLNVDDKDLDEDMVLLPRSKESSLWTQTSLQLVLQRSMGARLEILCSVNQPLYKLSYEETLALSTRLVKLCQDSDALLRQLGPPPAVYASSPFYLNMLNCLLRRFVLALHRPFVGANMVDSRFYYSRKICLENSLALTLPESDETFHRLLVVGQGLFRETFQHAAVTICIEMLLRLAENAVDCYTARVNEAIGETFDKAVQSVLALNSQRLSNGETNIKGHVYLSMALAQIKATQAHRDPKPHMVHAAKESATFCLQLLQKVASDADLLLNGNSILPENDVTDQWSIDDLGLELIPFNLDTLDLWDF
ncbi:hypothetical protein MY3296_000443 [Beauveria thailandica]